METELRPGGPWRSLEATVDRQVGGNLCWAAVASAVSRFYAGPGGWTQERVAEAAFGGVHSRLWYAADALELCGVLADRLERPLSLAELAREIEGGRPVAARIRWDFGGGHVVLLTGCSAEGQVWVQDPEHGPSACAMADLTGGGYRGFGRWTHTYRTRPPA
jgi:hypothetical protein